MKTFSSNQCSSNLPHHWNPWQWRWRWIVRGFYPHRCRRNLGQSGPQARIGFRRRGWTWSRLRKRAADKLVATVSLIDQVPHTTAARAEPVKTSPKLCYLYSELERNNLQLTDHVLPTNLYLDSESRLHSWERLMRNWNCFGRHFGIKCKGWRESLFLNMGNWC